MIHIAKGMPPIGKKAETVAKNSMDFWLFFLSNRGIIGYIYSRAF